MSNVETFITFGNVLIEPQKVISSAIDEELVDVAIVGTDKDGNIYLAGSHNEVYTHFLLEKGKKAIMDLVHVEI